MEEKIEQYCGIDKEVTHSGHSVDAAFPKRIGSQDAHNQARKKTTAERMDEGRNELVLQITIWDSVVHAGESVVTEPR